MNNNIEEWRAEIVAIDDELWHWHIACQRQTGKPEMEAYDHDLNPETKS